MKIQCGIDPRAEAPETAAAIAATSMHLFGAVVQIYLDEHVIGPDRETPLKKSGSEIERILLVEFVKDRKLPDGSVRAGLGGVPLQEITPPTSKRS